MSLTYNQAIAELANIPATKEALLVNRGQVFNLHFFLHNPFS